MNSITDALMVCPICRDFRRLDDCDFGEYDGELLCPKCGSEMATYPGQEFKSN